MMVKHLLIMGRWLPESGMKRQDLLYILRKARVFRIVDILRFGYRYAGNFTRNRRFKKRHPDVILPPAYMMYESFQVDFEKYYIWSRADAQWIIDTVSPYVALHEAAILDWGCGPARVIRHFPDLLKASNRYFGSDYNAKTIRWCQNHIPGIHFSGNQLSPPLHFPDRFFSLIYAISVFTHLSEENMLKWGKELSRLVTDEGIVLLTTHGAAFKEKLTAKELQGYENNTPVIRGKVKEGHRTYSAFHPPGYMKNLFESCGFLVAEHVPGKRVTEKYISQDTWLLKKRV